MELSFSDDIAAGCMFGACANKCLVGLLARANVFESHLSA